MARVLPMLPLAAMLAFASNASASGPRPAPPKRLWFDFSMASNGKKVTLPCGRVVRYMPVNRRTRGSIFAGGFHFARPDGSSDYSHVNVGDVELVADTWLLGRTRKRWWAATSLEDVDVVADLAGQAQR